MVLVHAHRHLLWRLASLVLGCWKHARFSLGMLNHLAAHVVPSRCRALWVAPWSHTPWLDDGAPGWRRRRGSVREVTHYRWLLRQRASQPIKAPVHDADALGDPLEPLLIEITHRTVAKELMCREQSDLRIHLAAARVGGRSCWGQ